MRDRLKVAVMAAVAVGIFQAGVASADSVSDFYKGKTVSVVVGVAAGGLYSTYAQMMAPHFSRHIPGNPTVIVKHMTGAGGISAVNWVYEAAPKDGTVVVTPTSALNKRAAMGYPGIRWDPRKFHWIGGWSEAVNDCSVLNTAPATTIEQARKTEVVMGAFNKASNPYTNAMVINNIVGTKFKIITGYKGGAKVRLAIEKGELHGWCGQYLGWKTRKPEWLRTGKIVHLVQLASKRSPDMPNVPLLSEFAKTDEEREMLTFVQSSPDDRAMGVPPGVPADRVAALEKAYQATMRDPAFLADAKKLKLEIDPISAKEIQDFEERIMKMKPELIARLKKAMGAK